MYYNLGNAFYRSGNIAGAVWAFESCLKLHPNHLDAKYNLMLANLKVIDKVDLPEPPIYLKALTRDFQLVGGKIVARDFSNLDELLNLPEDVIVNCTGLGAKNLFNDEELMPIKGQITILLPQPEVDYMVDVVHHMVPRKDGILLAGTWEPGIETLEPNPEAIQRVMNSHMEFFEKMR